MVFWFLHSPCNTFHISSCHVVLRIMNTKQSQIYFYFYLFFVNSKCMTYISYLFKNLQYKSLPGEFNFGNEPRNRDKNRYRDILPCKLNVILFLFVFGKRWKVGCVAFSGRPFDLWPSWGAVAVGGRGTFLDMLEHGKGQVFYSRCVFQPLSQVYLQKSFNLVIMLCYFSSYGSSKTKSNSLRCLSLLVAQALIPSLAILFRHADTVGLLMFFVLDNEAVSLPAEGCPLSVSKGPFTLPPCAEWS